MAENQTMREMIEAVGEPLSHYRFLILDQDGKTPKITDIASAFEWMQTTCNSAISYPIRRENIEASEVSTVFISSIVMSDDSPALKEPFETMILSGPHEGFKRCYRSFDEAVSGHEQIVQGLKDLTTSNNPPGTSGP